MVDDNSDATGDFHGYYSVVLRMRSSGPACSWPIFPDRFNSPGVVGASPGRSFKRAAPGVRLRDQAATARAGGPQSSEEWPEDSWTQLGQTRISRAVS